MNYVIIRDKTTFRPIKSVGIVSFECSYGFEQFHGSNDFTVKIMKSEGIVELGSFVQFKSNNTAAFTGSWYDDKTDWIGKVLARDIDERAGIVIYTGVSMLGALNNFVPVREPEQIETLTPLQVSVGDYYPAGTDPEDIPQEILNDGLNKIRLLIQDKVNITPIIARLQELISLAEYPIYLRQGENTYFGVTGKPSNYDAKRGYAWADTIDNYLKYRFIDNQTYDDILWWDYCTDENVYPKGSTKPSGVKSYFNLLAVKRYVELNHYTGVTDILGLGNYGNTEFEISVKGSLILHIWASIPTTDDYIYVTKNNGGKVFHILPYTAQAYGDSEGTEYSHKLNRLITFPASFPYYSLNYANLNADNSFDWRDNQSLYKDSRGGNIYMNKQQTGSGENGSITTKDTREASEKMIERLSQEITVYDDTDFRLSREYVFVFSEDTPEELFSAHSELGSRSMRLWLHNKRIVADAYTAKKVFSFYPQVNHGVW